MSPSQAFIIAAAALGWHLARRNGHLQFRHESIGTPVWAPATPSDYRSYLNCLAEMKRLLRQAGLLEVKTVRRVKAKKVKARTHKAKPVKTERQEPAPRRSDPARLRPPPLGPWDKPRRPGLPFLGLARTRW
jgi:hypothetical protein